MATDVEGNHKVHPSLGGEAEQEKIVVCSEKTGGKREKTAG